MSNIYRGRVLDEYLALSHLVLIGVHVDTFQDVSDCFGPCQWFLISRICFIRQNLISRVKSMKYRIMGLEFCSPFNKLIERSSVSKASLSNLDILYEAEICDLEIKGSLLVSQ